MVIASLRAAQPGTTERYADSSSTPTAHLVYLRMDGCGWCARFQPTWDELVKKHGAALTAVGVGLKQYDSTSESARALVRESGGQIKGYPTILLKRKDDGNLVIFGGDRTVDELLRFLADNGFALPSKATASSESFAAERVPSGGDKLLAKTQAEVEKHKPKEEDKQRMQLNAGAKYPDPY